MDQIQRLEILSYIRKPKNVYSRISEKKSQIKETESRLDKLNSELKALEKERDDLEIHNF